MAWNTNRDGLVSSSLLAAGAASSHCRVDVFGLRIKPLYGGGEVYEWRLYHDGSLWKMRMLWMLNLRVFGVS